VSFTRTLLLLAILPGAAILLIASRAPHVQDGSPKVPGAVRQADNPPRAAPDPDFDPEREFLTEALSDPRNLQPDAIFTLRGPAYTGALDARGMHPGEWVIGAVIGKTPVAFPVNVLNQHEVVVDALDGVPFLVCWCPLCSTGMVFLRTLDGEVLEFGHSGLLYRDAFLLYDTGTRSLWHNAEGRAYTRKMRGKRLEPVPSLFVKWDVWRKAWPGTRVLAKDPLDVQHSVDSFGHRNRRLDLKFGLGVRAGTEERLYEFSELDRMRLVQETVGGVPVVVAFQPDTETATAFDRTLEGRVLDLYRVEEGVGGLPRLEGAGEDPSVFDAVTGACLKGPLLGRSLEPLVGCWWEVREWTDHHPGGTRFRVSVTPPDGLSGGSE
jgi:hypothetical protein